MRVSTRRITYRLGSAITRGWIGLLSKLSTAAVLSACSSLPHLGSPIASYAASNVLSPSGYTQTKLDDTHYQVKATGTEATPTARVEKIARARAAEIGIEDKLQYFKVTSVQPSFLCTKKQAGYKSEPQPASGRPVVVLDVTYAHEALDAGFASSAESFKALSAEIAGEAVAPETSAAATQATRAGCGQG
jgi:hypothetical protein